MDPTTSTHFASAAASGDTWRDIAKKILSQLESIKTPGFQPDFGLLYISDSLSADASSILTLLKSVTGVKHWSGCVAWGVCGNGVEYIDRPAISVLVGMVGKEKVCAFEGQGPSFKKMHNMLEPWLNKTDAMLVIAHADPAADGHPARSLEELDALVGGFMVGGLSSARPGATIVADTMIEAGISGFVFSADVTVASTLSQGCVPMGGLHEISKGDDHVIAYLDGEKPLRVFSAELKDMTLRNTGIETRSITVREREAGLPEDASLVKGEAHVAFPVTGSDKKDFLVRNIMAIDPDNGMIAVGETIEDGQQMMFVHRDDNTVRSDLTQTLIALHKRIVHEYGEFKPKAALYVSCIARANVPFGTDGQPGGEMALIRDILGDIPMTGFYAGGEISNTRLYGYTGVLTLFL